MKRLRSVVFPKKVVIPKKFSLRSRNRCFHIFKPDKKELICQIFKMSNPDSVAVKVSKKEEKVKNKIHFYILNNISMKYLGNRNR